MNIRGKVVTLRAVEEGDLTLLHRWANDPALQDLLGDIHFPSSMEFHREWFRRLQDDSLNRRFAVDAGTGIIGLSSLMEIDWRNGRAFHGLLLGNPENRGKGYGKDAVMATMRYAFDELRFERLNGHRVEYNEASGEFYRELGWMDEGRRRNFLFRNGRHWDLIVTGILRRDYEALVRETNYWDAANG